jgi:hypothetical protein
MFAHAVAVVTVAVVVVTAAVVVFVVRNVLCLVAAESMIMVWI